MTIHDRENIRQMALDAGASKCGFALATDVDNAAVAIYENWLSKHRHGTMQYCEKYRETRNNPSMLLADGTTAKTVISCAFSYNVPVAPKLKIAKYALVNDYHYAVKGILNDLAAAIMEKYGGEARAVVDTAPIRERYWAQQAGLGFIGINNQLILPGMGSYFFLGEIIWSMEIAPDSPCIASCRQCMACVKACPTQSLDGKGGCDSSRCVSYLTIENKGDIPDGVDTKGWVYGCDSCQLCCPHNINAPLANPSIFQIQEEMATLSQDYVMFMSSSQFKKLTRHSAMSRITLKKLQSNIVHANMSRTIDNDLS